MKYRISPEGKASVLADYIQITLATFPEGQEEFTLDEFEVIYHQNLGDNPPLPSSEVGAELVRRGFLVAIPDDADDVPEDPT